MKEEEEENELLIYQSQMTDYVIGMGWSKDCNYIAIADAAGFVKFINGENEEEKFHESAHDGINCSSGNSTFSLFATGGQDGLVKIWDVTTSNLVNTIDFDGAWIEHVAWAPNGQYLAIAANKSVFIYDTSGKHISEYTQHESVVTGLSWRHDSKAIASACYKSVNVFEFLQNNIKKLPWQSGMFSISWSPDGKFICAGTQENSIHVWPAPFRANDDSEMSGYPAKVKLLAFDHQSKYLATNCMNDVILWKFAGKVPHGQQPIELKGHQSKLTQIAYQHQSKMILSGDQMGFALFWLPELSKEFISGAQLDSEVTTIAWSPDDLHVAVASKNGQVLILESPE